MRIASIDIGTNTALLLIADVERDGAFHVVSDEQTMVRLGQGVDRHRQINDAAFKRCLYALQHYQAKAAKADRIIVTGTSALRDAANRNDFVKRMHEKTGLRIEILSGEDEARWTYAGAIAGMDLLHPRAAVLDIGGGSTELTVGEGANVSERKSLDIGCVRLTERFFPTLPPSDGELAALEEYIGPELESYPEFDPSVVTFVGVAGTVTTLAAVDLGLADYDREKVSGHTLSLERIEELYERFRPLTHRKLVDSLRVDPGRADIILSGIIILRDFMRLREIPQVVVSAQGLRYGIALREAQRT